VLYFAAGAGWGNAYNGDNLDGSGFLLTAEIGWMLGFRRSWGRVVPFIEVPFATWTVTQGNESWKPGVGFPLFGIKLLL
jgi:hypothetical protein